MTFKAITSPIFDRLLRVHTDPRIDHDPPFRPLQQCQHPRDVGSLEPTWAQQLDFGLWLRCQCQCEEYSSSSFKKKIIYYMAWVIRFCIPCVQLSVAHELMSMIERDGRKGCLWSVTVPCLSGAKKMTSNLTFLRNNRLKKKKKKKKNQMSI